MLSYISKQTAALLIRLSVLVFIACMLAPVADTNNTYANSPQSTLYWLGSILCLNVVAGYIYGLVATYQSLMTSLRYNHLSEIATLATIMVCSYFFGFFASAPMIAWMHNFFFDPMMGLGSDWLFGKFYAFIPPVYPLLILGIYAYQHIRLRQPNPQKILSI